MPQIDTRPARLDINAAAGDDVALTFTTTTTTWLDGETLSAPVTTLAGASTGVSFTASWNAGTLSLSLTDTDTGTTLGQGRYKWRLTGTESGVTTTHIAGNLILAAQSDGSGTTSGSYTVNVTSSSVTLSVIATALGQITEHIADTVDAHDASAISVLDSAGYFTGTDAESVFAEIGSTFRLARGNRFAIIGDSIATGHPTASTVLGSPANQALAASWFNVACQKSLGTMRYVINAGVSGNTTTQMLARIQTDVIAYAPQWCIVMGGTNDSGTTEATTRSNLAAIYTALLAAGIMPIACTIPPRTDSGSAVVRINPWIRAYATKNRLPLLDFHALLTDNGANAYKSGYDYGDGVHPSLTAIGVMADYCVTKVASLVPAQPATLGVLNTETNNLIANALFLTDTNADGVPDNWTLNVNGSSTTTPSLVADSSGMGKLFTLTTTVAGTTRQYTQTISSGFTVGNTIGFGGRFSLSGDGTFASDCLLTFTSAAGHALRPVSQWKANISNGAFWMERTVPTGTTAIVVAFNVANGGGTGAASIGQLCLYDLTSLGV